MSLIIRDGGRTRLLPPAYFWLALVLAVGLHFVWPLADLLDLPWNLLGLVPLLAGAVINLLADRAFTRHTTTVKPYEESDALIQGGVFRWSRNPMYVGMTLIIAGVALLCGSLSPYLAAVAFAVVMDRVFIRVEEGMLAGKFGAAWDEYRRLTRRWI